MVYSQSLPLAAPQSLTMKRVNFGPDLAARLICPACRDPQPHVFEDFGSGHFVCPCGLILGDQIVNMASQWETFTNAEEDSEDFPFVDATSSSLMKEMEQLDTVTGSHEPRAASLQKDLRALRKPISAFRDISYWCEQFSESETISDTAKQLYKRSYEAKLLRGKPLDAVIAACIFVAFRQANIPRTFHEICNIMRISKKLLGQCYRALVRAFDLSPRVAINPASSAMGPETFLGRYCDHLDLSARVYSVCSDIIVASRKHGIAVGRSPVSIAGGAIYFTCHLLGEVKLVRDICAVVGVSEATLKVINQLFHENKAKLVKQEWVDEGRSCSAAAL